MREEGGKEKESRKGEPGTKDSCSTVKISFLWGLVLAMESPPAEYVVPAQETVSRKKEGNKGPIRRGDRSSKWRHFELVRTVNRSPPIIKENEVPPDCQSREHQEKEE